MRKVIASIPVGDLDFFSFSHVRDHSEMLNISSLSEKGYNQITKMPASPAGSCGAASSIDD